MHYYCFCSLIRGGCKSVSANRDDDDGEGETSHYEEYGLEEGEVQVAVELQEGEEEDDNEYGAMEGLMIA